MRYNKVPSVSDYPDLLGHEPPYKRKQWEVKMALRTLRDHGAVHPDAEILGAGAGHEATIYHLSNEVKRVWATDLYLDPGVWKATANGEMLADVNKFAPEGVAYDARRIVVQHMDMCNLQYADDTFDGVFSSGSIEHVGSFADVLKAASELGRVLKPGGVLSLATEYRISGDGIGWPGVLLLDEGQLDELIAATGCEPIDKPDLTVDEDTLATVWPLGEIVRNNKRPDIEAVLKHEKYKFTSVHLALRKPGIALTPSPAPTRSSQERVAKETPSGADAPPHPNMGEELPAPPSRKDDHPGGTGSPKRRTRKARG